MDEYQKHATFYDPFVGPFLHATHGDMVNLVQKHGCRTVLDLCCGTGLFIGAAQKAGLMATGVDISPAMLNVARKNHPEVAFLECDASSLPEEKGAYDAVTISFALHEKPRAAALAIIKEGVRLVRNGGLLVVADYRMPEKKNSFGSPFSFCVGLGIRCVEYMAGKEHNAHFYDYMERGGSEAFFVEAGLEATGMVTHMGGWSGVFVHVVDESS